VTGPLLRGHHRGVDLKAVIDELYGVTPAEFTKLRDGKAKAARDDGDSDLAEAIKQLRKPTSSAWLANILARERESEIQELLELGEAMREAQQNLQGEALRTLSQQRSQVIAAMVRDARGLAEDQGQKTGNSVADELYATLEAALADEGVGAAVEAGRLTTAIRYTGIGEVDLSAAVAGASPRKPVKKTKGKNGPDPAKLRQAETAVREAREALDAAKQRANADRRRAAEVRERADGLTRQIEQLEEHRRRLRKESDDASKVLRRAERTEQESAGVREQAEAALEQARAELTRLRGD
jgi:hypothetical protein